MLSRGVRLRSGRDFRAVYGRSRTFSTPRLVLLTRCWNHGRPKFSGLDSKVVRFGFSISKKTAKKSHDRNKIKRQLREIIRLRVIPKLNPDLDCDTIINVRSPAVNCDFEELAADVRLIFKDSGMLLS